MLTKNTLIIISLSLYIPMNCFIPHAQPICIIPTPDSILSNKEAYKPLCAGSRWRYATCTGAAWFHGNYLATLNLLGKKIITYRLDPEENRYSILQEIQHEQPISFGQPEAMCVSPDGTLLALCDNHPGAAYIHVYALDLLTHLINPSPVCSLKIPEFIHNIRFTPDNAYLAVALFNKDKTASIYKINHDQNRICLNHAFTHKNNYSLLKGKGVNFSRNGKYLVMAYALSINDSIHMPFESLVTVHQFNAKNGTIGSLICSVPGIFSFEDVTFLDNDHILALSDQGNDALILYPFDPSTGQINPQYTSIENPDAQLSFPHGVAASHDGRFLVATNYGNDTCTVYKIE